MPMARADTDFPAVRQVLTESGRWDDAQVETLLEELFPESHPDDIENFMRGVQNFARQAAPVVQRALPGVAAGAAQGAMIGGPWGALVGAAAGGAAGALSKPSRPAQPTAPRPAAPAVGVPVAPPALRPGPAAGPAAPATAPPARPLTRPAPAAPAATRAPAAPAAQLLTLLSRPETMQALLALMMASAGRASVSVGGRNVPAAAFAEAIAETAAAAAEAAGTLSDDALAEHLVDSQGLPRGDLASPFARAQLLLADLTSTTLPSEEETEEDAMDLAWEYESVDEDADPIEAYEAAVTGRMLP